MVRRLVIDFDDQETEIKPLEAYHHVSGSWNGELRGWLALWLTNVSTGGGQAGASQDRAVKGV